MGLEDTGDYVGVPGEAREGQEERARRRPGLVAEYVGDTADDVAGVGRGWGLFGLGLWAAAVSGREEVAWAAEHFRRRRGCGAPRRWIYMVRPEYQTCSSFTSCRVTWK